MPKNLMAGFKTSHQALVNSVDQIQLNMRDYLRVKPHLRELHANLLAHFSRQNHVLFEQLNALNKDDRQASKMLEFLELDLRDLKIRYLVFYDQHSGELADSHGRNFTKNFTEFAGAILGRVKIEEEYMFPLLEKLPNQDAVDTGDEDSVI